VDDGEGIAAHIPPLRRYARALTGDYTTAEDLVQDTLERAWKRLRLWRRGSNLRAWLFTIMHNLFINQLKTASSIQGQLAGDEAVDFPITSTQEERIELRYLNNALRRLPHEQREVVLLIGLEQMTYDEAAKVLGVASGRGG
jgi:RNA polymerase sigma-70 factor, ECF subfamily